MQYSNLFFNIFVIYNVTLHKHFNFAFIGTTIITVGRNVQQIITKMKNTDKKALNIAM